MLTMLTMHREPAEALHAALRNYRLAPVPANHLLATLMMLERRTDPRLAEVALADVKAHPMECCPRLTLWASEVSDELKGLVAPALAACQSR